MGDVLKWLKSIELRNMMLTLREEELNSIPDKKNEFCYIFST
jgi:hypothetical protein